MEGAEEEVERQAPVGQVGEVGEGLPGGGGEAVGVVPAEDGEDGGEGVGGEEEAEGGEQEGRQEPGGGEAGCRVEGLGDAEEGVDLRHRGGFLLCVGVMEEWWVCVHVLSLA